MVLTSMFGGFTGFQSKGSNDFGERMINSVATQSLRHLFSSSDAVEVAVRCSPPSKLLQGTIDSFRMEGRGLIIRKEFEAAEMMFETDAVSIDVGSAISGKIRLRQPTQAVAQVVLNEDAINRAFEAQLVRQHLEGVTDEAVTSMSGGDPVTFRDIHITLMPDQKVKITAKTDLPNRKDLPIQLLARVTVEKRRRIIFADAEFLPDGIPDDVIPLSETLTNGFAEVLNRMVDLERFNLDGVLLRVNRLETKGNQLVFSGYAQIEHFPGMV
ncbi:LmeA family phospholipid-binding protein [Nodosilinea sp. AN01ver1]|uniref:LmeA family phospholipid-binding protein n=1 Tax=Nodosilinea sp. AN01ver1 TaxID=3423362 RepID=UPI003D324512